MLQSDGCCHVRIVMIYLARGEISVGSSVIVYRSHDQAMSQVSRHWNGHDFRVALGADRWVRSLR